MDHKHTNRLIDETSPYLQQHAHNPVDWYPWGEEAFALAKEQDKPIFLSVGYSTCYWCHVMERESFESEAIAAEMNDKFVCIKVDREERPDVDSLYMLAVQVLTKHGGWPMSVFLMPDGRPFWGGTYFPPNDMYGRPGFPTVLNSLDDAWKNRREDITDTATRLTTILNELAEPRSAKEDVTINEALIDSVLAGSVDDYDSSLGGFGDAPKFPRQTLLELILHRNDGSANAEIMSKLTHTLDAMALGGIRDQLGGAFHRYSTDAKWLVPHFEIMLYDNGMLAWIYAEAMRQTGEKRFGETARGICDFVLREMTSADGAFFTAFDAEVDAREGKSYLWTEEQVRDVLGAGDDVDEFVTLYGLGEGKNFADPHHDNGVPSANVLFLKQPLTDDQEKRMAPVRQKLYEARAKRKQPLLDTKVLTSWNALMIRGMAKTGGALGEQRYIDAAAKAADHLLQAHRKDERSLWRSSRDGKPRHAGVLDDYAFLAHALLELHAHTGDARWRTSAEEISGAMMDLFADRERGGFYFTPGDASDLIVRQKIGADSPLASGNAIAAIVLSELGQNDLAQQTVSLFAGQLADLGPGMSATVQAASICLAKGEPWQISGVGQSGQPATPEEQAAAAANFAAQWDDARTLKLTITMAEGMYVQGHDTPKPFEAFQVLQVQESEADDPVEAQVGYPLSREVSAAGITQRVYENTFDVTIEFAEPYSGEVMLQVRYQACQETACLPPVKRHLRIAGPEAQT